ncbi:hypothetical protein EP7_000290 [Isosphaeraceae bacterium EP7]
MTQDRRRKADARRFQPSLDGRLEPRLLLSGTRTQIAALPGKFIIQVAGGGTKSRVVTPTGQIFDLVLTGTGSVKATGNARTGKVDIVVQGTNQDTELTINLMGRAKFKGSAHTYASGAVFRTNILNVNSIKVSSGTIGSILGYRTAMLTGPITVAGTNKVERIAFSEIAPSASINVGGDLNTLDVINNASFSGPGTGVTTGRDLNSVYVGGNLSLADGASITVGRDLGLTAQPAKGTGPSGQGMVVQGNFTIGATSALKIVRNVVGSVVVQGNLTGSSRISAAGGSGALIVSGTTTP